MRAVRINTGMRLTVAALLMGSTTLSGAAFAQDAAVADEGGIEEIVVTAQKRSENLQSVPMSVQAFSTEKLKQLQVSDFDDYAKYLPSVSFQSIGPGAANVYFRGVASGENANHSSSLPSVGT
jgi:outer membrane receptor protein involved in Fe transport